MKNGDRTTRYYPVFLDVKGRRCVVVGGGTVALRKVKGLLEHGAAVEVVSPEVCSELSRLGQEKVIKVTQRSYVPTDLKEAFMAIVATDDSETNRKVAEEARGQRILVNVVDDPQKSEFIVPSYLRRGDLSIAVSTGGKSPALARKIRIRLEQSFGYEYALLTLLIDEVRSEFKRKGIATDSLSWQEAVDLDLLLPMLKHGRTDEAKAALVSKLEVLAKQAR